MAEPPVAGEPGPGPRAIGRLTDSVAAAEDAAELRVLSAPVLAVLRCAADIVASRPDAQVRPERVMRDPPGIRVLFDLLARSEGLRRAVRAARGQTIGTPALVAEAQLRTDAEADAEADALCGSDPAACAATASALRTLMSRARDEERRAARRAKRGRPEERAAARQQVQLAETRATRDRLRGQLGQAEATVRDLRERIAEQDEDLRAAHATIDALSSQIRHAERAQTDLGTLSERLADAIAAESAPGAATPVPAPDRLARAAALAGVPEAARFSVADWLPALLRALTRPAVPPAALREVGLEVTVLGGGEEIGGSCVLVTAGATRILVDAGARPGGATAASTAPARVQQALAGRIDAIVLTHAHNDHAGWVPAIIREQPQVPIFTSEATGALLAIMWLDSAKVMARRADERPGTVGSGAGPAVVEATTGGAPPPFTADDVGEALRRVITVPIGARRRVGDLRIELFPAGHIVGASGVVVHAGADRVVITGDVSRPGQRTVGGLVLPPSAVGAALMLLESTYAGQSRPMPRQRSVDQFVSHIREITGAGGRVLVPAFALGRAQEIALILTEALPDVDVLIDGLAGKVSEVFERFEGPDGRRLQIFAGRARLVKDSRAEIARFRTGVVVATSGMLNAGPAVRWAESLLPDPRAGLMVVGYQDEESPGRRLLELSEAGGGVFELPRMNLPPVEVEVLAAVRQYGLGAHASADELVGITAEAKAREVMLVHGEPRGQRAFSERLRLRGQATVAASRAWTRDLGQVESRWP